VTIYYPYHPLRGQSLPVVRLYAVHDESHYVVRRTGGLPLAVPGWMTDPEAAYVHTVSVARLPLCVLLELRRMAVTYLSSSVHNVQEEDHVAAVPSKIPTTTFRGAARRTRGTISTGGARPAAPGAGAVAAGSGEEDARGGRR
jgi:hypothetical protein